MDAVSSVTAFLARCRGGAGDAKEKAILAVLDEAERLVLEARDRPAAERAEWLEEKTGHARSRAAIDHVERRAMVRLRRELQRRGLWRD